MSTTPQPVAWFDRDDPTGGTLNLQPERAATPDEPLPEIGCTTDHHGGPCDCTVLDTNPAVTRSCYACPSCDGETRYQSMSGGREWYCPDCGADGYYPEGAAPRRVQMLADGRFDELRAEMREELAQRVGETRTALDTTPAEPVDTDEPVHDWFGLSYANYAVQPRTLLQSMPVEWQRRWVQLAVEFEQAFAHVRQAPGYHVTPCEWREPWECSAEELAAAGITDEAGEDGPPQFYDPDGNELDPNRACVPGPVRDPIPHYDRGRARVQPRIEASQ